MGKLGDRRSDPDSDVGGPGVDGWLLASGTTWRDLMLWETQESRVTCDVIEPELLPVVGGRAARAAADRGEERQPPRKKAISPTSAEVAHGVEVSVMARPGRAIDEVVRFEPATAVITCSGS